MSELFYAVVFVLWLIAVYFIGRTNGHRKGYEKGKEMWKHPSQPTDSSFEETQKFSEVAREITGSKWVSVQKRKHKRGGYVWFVRAPAFGRSDE